MVSPHPLRWAHGPKPLPALLRSASPTDYLPVPTSYCPGGRIKAPPVPAAIRRSAEEMRGAHPLFLNSLTHSERLPCTCHFAYMTSFHPHKTWYQRCFCSLSQRSKTGPGSDVTFPRSQSKVLVQPTPTAAGAQCGFHSTTLASIPQALLGEGQPGHCEPVGGGKKRVGEVAEGLCDRSPGPSFWAHLRPWRLVRP